MSVPATRELATRAASEDALEPRVVRATRGRVRVHLPAWSGGNRLELESHVQHLGGVAAARANPVTRNVLVEFDPRTTTRDVIVRRLAAFASDDPGDAANDEAPPVFEEDEQDDQHSSAHIAVRGLDRNPGLATRVIRRLRRLPNVSAHVNWLTGRVVVDYDPRLVTLQDLLIEVSRLELPPMPGEDRPAHPLDPAPLYQSASRTIGAALGLTVLATMRMLGRSRLTRTSPFVFGSIAGAVGLLQGFPPLKSGLRKVAGDNAGDLAAGVTSILSLTFAKSPLGLLFTLAESGVLLAEVMSRRGAWRRYQDRLGGASDAAPGTTIHLVAGDHMPLSGTVVEGTGTAVGRDGLPRPVAPGHEVSAGAALRGGPFVVQLQADRPFHPQPRPAPLKRGSFEHYLHATEIASLAFSAVTLLATRSPTRAFVSLLLLNPRTAVIGSEIANLVADNRTLRGGITIVGTRTGRAIRRPDVLVLDTPRLLADAFEVTSVIPLARAQEPDQVLSMAAGIALAAGSPWGGCVARGSRTPVTATRGHFDGKTASAHIEGRRYTLGPEFDPGVIPQAERARHRGEHILLLADDRGVPLSLFTLRPRLARGALQLAHACRLRGVRLVVLPAGDDDAVARAAERVHAELYQGKHDHGEQLDEVAIVRDLQADGSFVAYVADSMHAADAFAQCDLSIGLASAAGEPFPARADLLAPDLFGVADIVEAGARREAVARDAVGLSIVANGFGMWQAFQGQPNVLNASRGVYVTALTAVCVAWMRLRGGHRYGVGAAMLTDPRPERWGSRSIEEVLRVMDTRLDGLTNNEVMARRLRAPHFLPRNEWLEALRSQLELPMTVALGGGAALFFLMGDPLDGAILGGAVVLNIAVGVWQERQIDVTADALKRLSSTTHATVLRGGETQEIAPKELVTGDIIVLKHGDRVPADARVIDAEGLEVDEADITGESLPVQKRVHQGADADRIVLEGSDVLLGSGRAVVVATGRKTRMGSIAAAMALDETERNPLGERLSQIVQMALPLAVAGGALTMAAGLVHRQRLGNMARIGITTALSVIPEGLPLLAGTGQAGVARRLAQRKALVRRLSAIEALGRVDVACTDKTGTLTRGRLAVRVVADAASGAEGRLPDDALSDALRHVLLAAAIASPHPDAEDAYAHKTDEAMLRAAFDVDLGRALRAARETGGVEVPFDPVRGFHATRVNGKLFVKGAPETLVPRCHEANGNGALAADALLDRSQRFAARGLRMLMVAEGGVDADPEDPQQLTPLGFVGMRDPLRLTVPGAMEKCHAAGVRVIMLTGDHPATAEAIARQAGMFVDGRDEVVVAGELAEMHDVELDDRLKSVVAVARATPLDKLRIVESLRRGGHVVAMTGDGVNDAPALRLADVGVAMGASGTDVARQASELVLGDDDFATLVEALVEGRAFWQNMRRGTSLLLGGNLGELGLIAGSSLLGWGSVLSSRQILMVNLITDALPALAVVLQPPEHRQLSALAREGVSSLDASLRTDVLRRAITTAGPSLLAAAATRRRAGEREGSSVAFASIVGTQLGQTLAAGRVENALSRSVVFAVGGSAAILAGSFVFSPVRRLLGLVHPGAQSWATVGTAAVASHLLSQLGHRPAMATVPPPITQATPSQRRPPLS